MKVNVLGTEYKVIYETERDNQKLKTFGGYCERYAKELHIKHHTDEDEEAIERSKNIQVYEKKTIYHELIHAFMYEAGLDVNSNTVDQWAMNEEMIDWFAIQIPKIVEAYYEVMRQLESEENK